MSTSTVFKLVAVLAVMISAVAGHGAMTFPPARNTGSYDWHSANKGAQEGVWTNESTNACGAPQYITPGPVVATFTAGQTVSIEVTISAFHGGYYEFRLCVPKNVNDPAPSTNQAMLDCLLDPSTPILKRVNPLQPGQRADYKIITPPVWTQQQLETRWRQNPEDGVATGKTFGGQVTRTLEYKLPDNVQCRNCVLHWYWQSLNSWQSGTSDSIGTSTGERFWNCADITIIPRSGAPLPPPAPTLANCWDGMQNQGETDVDCGGPCAPCAPHTPPATPQSPPSQPPAIPETPQTQPGSCPQWSSSAKYVVNNVVSYNGQFYSCRQAHTANAGWNPEAAFTLWARVSSCSATSSAMESNTANQETVENAGSHTEGSTDGNIIPGWGIALICLGVAIVGTQIIYFVYRVKRDQSLGSERL